MRRVNPDTLQAALKIAQREEDILVAENNSNTDNQSRLASIQVPVAENQAQTSLEQRINDLEGTVNEQIKAMQELVQQMRRQNVVCYKCGKRAHIQRYCKSLRITATRKTRVGCMWG